MQERSIRPVGDSGTHGELEVSVDVQVHTLMHVTKIRQSWRSFTSVRKPCLIASFVAGAVLAGFLCFNPPWLLFNGPEGSEAARVKFASAFASVLIGLAGCAGGLQRAR